MDPWQTILLALGGNVALLAVLGWLSQSFVSQLLAKDIEGFKATLRSESESASQRLRHDLEKATIEHQVRFSKLHEKRAEVIAELYGFLVQAYWDISSFASHTEWQGEPRKQEKYAAAMNSSASFFRFFDKHRIYIPEPLCNQVDEFAQAMRGKAIGFGVYVSQEDGALPDHVLQQKREAWVDAWKYFEEEAPNARAALENELRAILGGAS